MSLVLTKVDTVRPVESVFSIFYAARKLAKADCAKRWGEDAAVRRSVLLEGMATAAERCQMAKDRGFNALLLAGYTTLFFEEFFDCPLSGELLSEAENRPLQHLLRELQAFSNVSDDVSGMDFEESGSEEEFFACWNAVEKTMRSVSEVGGGD